MLCFTTLKEDMHKLKETKTHSLSRQLRPIFEEILPSLNREDFLDAWRKDRRGMEKLKRQIDEKKKGLNSIQTDHT